MVKIKSHILEESSKSHASSKLIAAILMFLVMFIVMQLLEGIIPSIMMSEPLSAAIKERTELNGGTISVSEAVEISQSMTSIPKIMLATLYSTVFGTLVSMLYCRFGEMRKISSMGVRKRKCLSHYLLGLAVGLVLMTVLVLLSAVTGTLEISVCKNINFGLIAVYIGGWFLQGMSEEFIFRGYLMASVGGKHSAVTALIVSSAGFSLAHASNPGFGVLVFFNLALFAAFAGLYILYFDDIWGACAIHSVWNFSQGNLYGISVSGTGDVESVFRTTAASGSKLLTGGDFGIEGSIFTTILMLAACAVMVVLMKKKGMIEITEKA